MRKTQLLRIDNGRNSLKYREFYKYLFKNHEISKNDETLASSITYRIVSHRLICYLADMHTKKPIALFVTEK